MAALLWRGVVPLLPFVLLLNVRLWRNVCPLGRLSEGSPRVAPRGAPRVPPRIAPRVGGAILLFAAILPIRAVWLAESAAYTALFLIAVGVVAVVTGRRSPRRSGFCTTLCPMLPVELLYGQSPLVSVGRGTCETCTLCTPRACPQLSPRAAIAQHLGAARHGPGWTRTPFGAFAAAFPGVISAFFLGPTTSIPVAAATLAAGAAGSWLVVAGAVAVLRPAWDRALPVLGFASIGLWAWFALPVVARAWGWAGGAPLLRAAGVTLAIAWLAIALRPGRPGELPTAPRFS